MTSVVPKEIKTTKYADKVFPLSKDDYERLKNSIATHGLYDPITINKQGYVLDGHHRLKVCEELGIDPRFEIRSFDNELQEELFVYEVNRARRQLTTFQNVELGLKEKPLLAQLAQQNMRAGIPLPDNRERVHTDKILARKLGVSKDTLYKVEQVLQAAQENPTRELGIDYEGRLDHIKGAYPTYIKVAEDARRGKLSVYEAYNLIKRDQLKEQRYVEIATAAKELAMPEKVVLLNRDSMQGEIPEIKDNSVDLIFTDPPYLDKYIGVYEQLARFAIRKLKPGGNLIFYYGHLREPELHAMFAKYKDQLRYWWTIAVAHERANGQRLHIRAVICDHKPMIWFVKGDRSTMPHYVHDFIGSLKKPNKLAHPWAQGRQEAEQIISDFTVSKDALVVDPFMGSGEFLIPAIKMGRYVVGIEKDKKTFEHAANYIKTETSEK
jgi:DNA methylase/ParB-like nuclease domain